MHLLYSLSFTHPGKTPGIFSHRIKRSECREYRENIELYIGLIAVDQCVPGAHSTAGDYSGLVSRGRGSVLLLATSTNPGCHGLWTFYIVTSCTIRAIEGMRERGTPTVLLSIRQIIFHVLIIQETSSMILYCRKFKLKERHSTEKKN